MGARSSKESLQSYKGAVPKLLPGSPRRACCPRSRQAVTSPCRAAAAAASSWPSCRDRSRAWAAAPQSPSVGSARGPGRRQRLGAGQAAQLATPHPSAAHAASCSAGTSRPRNSRPASHHQLAHVGGVQRGVRLLGGGGVVHRQLKARHRVHLRRGPGGDGVELGQALTWGKPRAAGVQLDAQPPTEGWGCSTQHPSSHAPGSKAPPPAKAGSPGWP